MNLKAANPKEYLENLPDTQREAVKKLRQVVIKNMPKGLKEVMAYGALGYVVPHAVYPDGYHCDPKQPLPFISIAAQKNSITLHHMGIYANPVLLKWFITEYPKHCTSKLDMGKGCVRFKKPDQIPFQLVAELLAKMSVEEWIKLYETNLKRKS